MNKFKAGALLLPFLAAAWPAYSDISDGKIKIGILNDQSSVYADTTGLTSYQAALIAVEEFGGSLLGMPIEVVTADHQNKPDVGAGIAQRWFDTEQVDAIMGLPNSAVALSVQALARPKKRITIASEAASTVLTGEQCSPYGFMWTIDTHALAVATGSAVIDQGLDSWFFITADYAFGHSLEENTANVVTAEDGQVLGSARHPPNTTADFSSFLLQAQASGAKVIGLANGGADVQNAIKQAGEFGITAAGQSLAALLITLPEVHSLGLDAAQGLMLTESYYWNRDEQSAEFAEKVFARTGVYPNMFQAGTYSAVRSYLKAIEAAGTDDADAVAEKLRELPVNDAFARDGVVQPNGRMVSDVYLFRVKAPEESTAPWDYYELVAVVPGKDAYLDPAESGCAL